MTHPAPGQGTPGDAAPSPSPEKARWTLPPTAAASPLSHAILRVGRLHRMLVGQLLRRVGLHPGQELLMMQLWDTGPQRQADLIRVLESDAATMARSVRRLEQAGFVRRRPDPADRRAAIVEPTPASLALRAQVERLWRHLEEVTAGDLGADERAAAIEMLARIERNLLRVTDAEGGAGGE